MNHMLTKVFLLLRLKKKKKKIMDLLFICVFIVNKAYVYKFKLFDRAKRLVYVIQRKTMHVHYSKLYFVI